MADEIEAKLPVHDHQPVRDRLADAGGERLGLARQDERYFDWPDGSLRDGDRGLRVRVIRPAEGAGQPRAVVTYKGPRTDSALKVRREIEFIADEPSAVTEMLIALGLELSIRYEKLRETWRLGDCEVTLDTLPHIGLFVEIEGPDESAVQTARKTLGLADAPHENRSYLEMLKQYRRDHGLDETDIEL